MLNLNNIKLLLLVGCFSQMAFAEVLNTKWQINEDLIDQDTNELASEKTHLFQVGFASKNIDNLVLRSKNKEFVLNDQNVPGINVHYGHILNSSFFESTIYSHLGYFTTYNDLGADGYADLNLFDLYLGYEIGKTFHSTISIRPNLFAGIGYSYIFQRGDIKEVSADENYTEREIGAGLDFIFSQKDSYPDAWSPDYTISIRFTDFASINGEDDINGQKLSANFGVLL